MAGFGEGTPSPVPYGEFAGAMKTAQIEREKLEKKLLLANLLKWLYFLAAMFLAALHFFS